MLTKKLCSPEEKAKIVGSEFVKRCDELVIDVEVITELQSMRVKGQEAQNELRELKNYINSVNAPESCGQLSLLGVAQSKRMLVDPDGKGINGVPIEVSIANV